ncbi:hypothetical protein [Blastococcus deserti]|uniref:ABC-2 type transport system permease protein n=1 Tax=Blastococcus deserti TaxID=2259033 RepID=A0ABW4X6E9_9ACTN
MTTTQRAVDTVVGRPTLGQLARAEIRYTLRNPLLWVGALGAAALSWGPVVDGLVDDVAGVIDNYVLLDFGTGVLALVAFLVANWAAQRERPATTAELFSAAPARRWDRTVGLLAAAIVPTIQALVITIGTHLLVWRAGGVQLGVTRAVTLQPTPLEALGAPLAVGCAFVAGVALARLIRSRAVGALVGLIGWFLFHFTYWVWLTAPFGLFAVSRSALTSADLGREVSGAEEARWPAISPPDEFTPTYWGIDRDLGLYGLHLLYVVGVITALCGLALVRSGRDRRSWRLLGGGLVIAGVAVVVELLVHDGARVWMGYM